MVHRSIGGPLLESVGFVSHCVTCLTAHNAAGRELLNYLVCAPNAVRSGIRPRTTQPGASFSIISCARPTLCAPAFDRAQRSRARASQLSRVRAQRCALRHLTAHNAAGRELLNYLVCAPNAVRSGI